MPAVNPDLDPSNNAFTHDGCLYNLNLVMKLMRAQPTFILPAKALLWVLKYDLPDADRVDRSKLRYPLLVSRDKKKRWTVVDGLHRLEKYRKQGITQIPVKEVTAAILKAAAVPILHHPSDRNDHVQESLLHIENRYDRYPRWVGAGDGNFRISFSPL